MSNSKAFKDAMNNAMNKARAQNNVQNIHTCSGSCTKPGIHKCNCDENSECKDCACTKKKSERKPVAKTPLDDGCLCRKCNTFLPMVEPDDKGDGKALCYGCANPW